MKKIVFCLLLLFHSTVVFGQTQKETTEETLPPLPLKSEESTVAKPEEQPSQKQEDPYRFSFKKEGGAKYFSFYPGVQYLNPSLTINSPQGANVRMATDTNSVGENVNFLYDFKSTEWQLGKSWGVFILNRNAKFRLDRQVINFSTATDENARRNVDLQTEAFGTYSMLLPVVYLGSEGNDSFRLGFGMGLGKVNLQGTADFNDGIGLFTNGAVFNAGRTLNDKIDNLGRFALLTNGNIDGDPYRAYLLSNLSANGNLERLGLYSLFKGDTNLGSIDPLAFLMFASASNGQLNPLEIYALANLSKGRINSSTNYAKSFYLFFELPLSSNLTWRVGFGGPFYTQNQFAISIRGFEMSLYTPVEF